MVRIRLYSKNIDYNSIVEILMPFLIKGLSEKDNLFYEILTGVISRKGQPSRLSRFLVDIIPNKNRLAASLLPHIDDILMEYLNNQLLKYHIAARVSELTMKSIERSLDKMLKIEITMKDIDYDKMIESLLPVMLQRLSETEGKISKIADLLIGRKELPEKVVKAALRSVPEEQRDELLTAFLSIYQEEIRALINSMLLKNNIAADVSAFRIASE